MECPVEWKSKLQTDIATSTIEAEYSALSMALRAAIPSMDVCKYVISGFNITKKHLVTFKTTVHEGNQGALTLARLEPGRTTPRSKFYAIKHHWFRSWLMTLRSGKWKLRLSSNPTNQSTTTTNNVNYPPRGPPANQNNENQHDNGHAEFRSGEPKRTLPSSPLNAGTINTNNSDADPYILRSGEHRRRCTTPLYFKFGEANATYKKPSIETLSKRRRSPTKN
jgi:hypothetical protein